MKERAGIEKRGQRLKTLRKAHVAIKTGTGEIGAAICGAVIL